MPLSGPTHTPKGLQMLTQIQQMQGGKHTWAVRVYMSNALMHKILLVLLGILLTTPGHCGSLNVAAGPPVVME